MKAHFIIVLFIVGIALLLGVAFSSGGGSGGVGWFFAAFGTVNLISGLICLVLAVIFGIAGNKNNANSLAVAAGICLLIGTGSCSITFAFGLKL